MDKKILINKIQKLVNHYKTGNFIHVIKEGQLIIKKIPNNIFLTNLIAMSHQAIGNFKLAISGYYHIIGLDNQNKEAYNNLGSVFKSTNDLDEAKKNFIKALDIDPNFVDALTNLGNLYFELNDYENSINYLTKSLEINNKNALAHYNIGLVYQSIGEHEKSISHLKKVLALNPANTNADKLISRMTNYNEKNKHILEMEEKLNKLKLNDFQKIPLYFSLGKAYEDIKNYQKSFKYINNGNNIKKKLLNYSLKNEIKSFEKLRIFFDEFEFKFEDKFLQKKNLIFIVGLPRSGTSLIEQIISSHSKVYGCGELSYISDLTQRNFYSNRTLDISKLRNLTDIRIKNIGNQYLKLIENFNAESDVFTDKAPLNFMWVGIIKMLFPTSKIVHCNRNPKDNILSLYKNDFDGRLNFTYDYDDLLEFYSEYRKLMDFWKSKISEQIYNANYEEIVQDPENKIKDLLKFCDLSFEPKCLEFYQNKRPIKTVSSAQARKPIYDSSISSYKNYEEYMKDIFIKLDNLK